MRKGCCYCHRGPHKNEAYPHPSTNPDTQPRPDAAPNIPAHIRTNPQTVTGTFASAFEIPDTGSVTRAISDANNCTDTQTDMEAVAGTDRVAYERDRQMGALVPRSPVQAPRLVCVVGVHGGELAPDWVSVVAQDQHRLDKSGQSIDRS
jgi:hypothetical protein